MVSRHPLCCGYKRKIIIPPSFHCHININRTPGKVPSQRRIVVAVGVVISAVSGACANNK